MLLQHQHEISIANFNYKFNYKLPITIPTIKYLPKTTRPINIEII